MSLLDNQKIYETLDPSRQSGMLSAFAIHLTQGWNETSRIKIPPAYLQTKHTVFCGMGGSAIGADFVTALPAEYLKEPTVVTRGYDLPAWVGQQTLVITISYSGNTEETLACFSEARKRKASIITLTHGGIIERISIKEQYPNATIPDTIIPRASVAFQIGALVNILARMGKIPQPLASLDDAIQLTKELTKKLSPEVPVSKNPAKKIATFLHGKLPLSIGSGIMEPVARRFKDQINENAKQFAAFEVLPELNHNLTEGLAIPKDIVSKLAIMLFESDYDHPQVAKRYAVLKKLFKKLAISHYPIPSTGADIWSQKLTPTLLGDWASYYLGLLNRVDPTPVPTIEWTKNQL